MQISSFGRFCTAVSAVSAITILLQPAWGQAETKTAEQVYKNIKALTGTPADQVEPAMQFIAESLGVQCSYCHVQGKLELDEKKPKQTAREMIQMTNEINKGHFNERREVTCNSCHHGAAHPAAIPAVRETDEPERRAGMRAPAGPNVTADQILEKYVAALGGAEAIKKVTSRVETGSVLMGARETPIEVYAKAPNLRVSIMHMGDRESITAFDGKAGWLGNTGRPVREMSAAEADAAGLDAQLNLALDLATVFQRFRVGRPAKIGDTQCLTLMGTRPGLPPVELYFDEQTGLLVRMVRYIESPLGRNPTQIDYADYREVDGVKVPFRWTMARPNGRFTVQIKEVKQNVPVDDAKFAKPAA